MSSDPVAPILAKKHYPAMERRLHKIMAHVDKCITEHPNGVRGVVMSEFHNNVSHLNYANLLGFILYLRN